MNPGFCSSTYSTPFTSSRTALFPQRQTTRPLRRLRTTPTRSANLFTCVQDVHERTSPPSRQTIERSYELRTWLFKSFRIEYAVAGDKDPEASTKPALVLLHGFGANCQHWRYNITPLAQNGWRVYATDLLGFGMSDKPKPGTIDDDGEKVVYNFDYWTEQLQAFIKEIVHQDSNTPVFLIANSIGAMITMQLAVQNPDMCAAMVFISPSLRQLNIRKRSWLQDITAPFLMKLLSYRPIGAFFLESLAKPKQLRKVLLNAYEVVDAVDDELVELLSKPAKTEGALEVFLAFISYDEGPIPEDFLPMLRQPSMVIWGEDDLFEPYELGQALRHYSTVDKFVGLPGVGHCAHDEKPAEVNELIIEFVKKHIDRAGYVKE